jgi:hypothetical protein
MLGWIGLAFQIIGSLSSIHVTYMESVWSGIEPESGIEGFGSVSADRIDCDYWAWSTCVDNQERCMLL